MYTRKTALLAKIETIYGTDAVPTGAANALVIRNATLTPLDADMVDRALVRPYFGSSPKLAVAARVQLDFEVELAGSGAAGTVPAWGALLRGCAFSETISAGVSVAYAPVSAAIESLTIYTFIDGIKHGLTGARGTVDLDVTAKGIPVLKFKFTGLYVAPADVANPTLTTTAWQTPLPVNNANTSGFSLHGYAGILQALTMSIANKVAYRNLVGEESVQITDRAPTGSCTITAVPIGTKDFFTLAKNATLGALAITHGTVAGNKVTIAAPQVQVVKPTYGDQDGIRMLQMGLELVPSAGNDEITITAL